MRGGGEGLPDDICLAVLCSKNKPCVAVSGDQKLTRNVTNKFALISNGEFVNISTCLSVVAVSSAWSEFLCTLARFPDLQARRKESATES